MIAPVDEAWVRDRFVEHVADERDASAVLTDLVLRRCPLLDPTTLASTVDRLRSALLGLGPLDRFLDDPAVTDVLVNGSGRVWVDRGGSLAATDVVIPSADVAALVERAFRRNGLTVDRSHPIADTRLPSGARLSVILPPLAVDGTCLAIRRFPDRPHDLDAFGPPEVTALLRRYVAARANIVVFGPTGSGKTSLVNALAADIPPSERVVTIEDAAELRLPLPHVVRLECRPANGEGAGGVDLRTLVRAALRLRPDRLVVGEVRGAEALDMIWALATGHDGSLSTCHAKSAEDVLTRLETFVLLADAALPLAAVRVQVRSAVDVVVGIARRGDRRCIVSVNEVVTDPDHPSGTHRVYPR